MKLFSKEKIVNNVVSLPIADIYSNPDQPRVIFLEEDLKSLADSIKTNGILQPITVRVNSKNKYELVSGERRLKAAKLAGRNQIPSIVLKTSEEQSAIFALIENLQRKDLNFFEEAMAINKLIEKWGITQEEASVKLGKAQSTISNKIRLLKFSNEQKAKMVAGNLTERHARVLLKLRTDEDVNKVLDHIISKKLNVSQTELYVGEYLNKKFKKFKKSPKIIPVIKDVKIFFNSLDKVVKTMRKSGIMAKIQKEDSEDYIKYIVKIPHTSKNNVKISV